MDYNENASNRPLNVEEKLNTILKTLRSEGRLVVSSSQRLSDKICGSQPQCESKTDAPKPISDNAHVILDEIMYELNRVLNVTAAELDRSHRAIGDFGRDKSLISAAQTCSPDLYDAQIAKQSRAVY